MSSIGSELRIEELLTGSLCDELGGLRQAIYCIDIN